MSYHGGIVGALLGGAVYCRIHHRSLMKITDITTAGIPLGYTFGRLGNFINAELYGRVTAVPWGMVFPTAPGFSSENEWVRNIADRVGMSYQIGDVLNLPRHPSQLYEAFLEGALLFTVLWWFSSKPRVAGAVGSLFCMGYGLVRFIVEYFREPDSYLGLGLFGLSRGQWLSLPVFLLGLVVWIWVHRRKSAEN